MCRPWAPKDQQFGGTHFQTRPLSAAAVVDYSEQLDSFLLEYVLKLLHCSVDRVIAGYFDDPANFIESHRTSPFSLP